MPRPTTLKVHTYRAHRLELRDDGGDGWIVSIYGPPGSTPPEVLRNGVPGGLATLLAQAQRRVDAQVDGARHEALPGP